MVFDGEDDGDIVFSPFVVHHPHFSPQRWGCRHLACLPPPILPLLGNHTRGLRGISSPQTPPFTQGLEAQSASNPHTRQRRCVCDA